MSQAEPITRIHEVLALQARQRPDAVCLHEEGGGTLTYVQLWQRVQAVAGWLREQGVQPGHRVLMVGKTARR